MNETARSCCLSEVLAQWRERATLSDGSIEMGGGWATLARCAEQTDQELAAARATILQLQQALEPFAAFVHEDGIEAPYPEDEWKPMLWNAKKALVASIAIRQQAGKR